MASSATQTPPIRPKGTVTLVVLNSTIIALSSTQISGLHINIPAECALGATSDCKLGKSAVEAKSCDDVEEARDRQPCTPHQCRLD